jgi:Flp pilus assembly protein TadD
VTVNDEFTRIAEQCLTASDAATALQACDRAIAINDEDPMPWYGRVKALSALGRTAEADAALRRFDFVGRYYNGMLRPIQLLQRRILLADLVGSTERAAELNREISQVSSQLSGGGLSGDERAQAQTYLQRLQSIQEDYQQVQSNPELLQQLESNMIQTMVELRRGFVEATARLDAAN